MDGRETATKSKRAKTDQRTDETGQRGWTPWQIESPRLKGHADCDCDPVVDHQPEPARPERIETKQDSCCEQILEALRCIPGIDEKCLKRRKPKTPPHVKLLNLGRDLPGKESIAPLLMLILRRYRNNVPPGNDFEARLHDFLSGFSAKQMEPLTVALDAYDALPQALREEVFESRFDHWPNNEALEPDFLKVIVGDRILELGQHFRKGEGLKPGPGKMRLWERSYPVPGEPGRSEAVMGPWPYICAISPTGARDFSVKDWFRNESARYPDNSESPGYHLHEFARECALEIAPPSVGGGVRLACHNVEPGAGWSSGQGGFAECLGGIDYQVTDPASGKQLCLKIPTIVPGATVALRGFNYFTTRMSVIIRKADGSWKDPLEVGVSEQFGDFFDDGLKAHCGIRDMVFFTFPGTRRKKKPNGDPENADVEIEPGLYTLEVKAGGTVVGPAASMGLRPGVGHQYVSNRVLVELLPPTDKKFSITCDSAFCIQETDGGGADEPWFQSMTALLTLPDESDSTLDMQWSAPVDIFNVEDVDSGEWISFPSKQLFSGPIAGQLLAVGVIGLEIDSEDAAKERVKGFWNSYVLYLKQVFVQLGLEGGGSVLTDAIKEFFAGKAFPWWGYVAGGVMALIAAGGFLFAAWAEADLLALDVMVLGPGDFHALTDRNTPSPVDPWYYWLPGTQIFVTPLGKKLETGGQEASYREARVYRSSEEHSRYELKYTIRRF